MLAKLAGESIRIDAKFGKIKKDFKINWSIILSMKKLLSSSSLSLLLGSPEGMDCST